MHWRLQASRVDSQLSKEALQQNAPDVKYVPPISRPKSYMEALEILQAQRKAADDISNVVAAGRLEEAGIKLLNLIPKVTVAGQVILDSIMSLVVANDSISQLRQSQLEAKYSQLIAVLGQCDISMGQGLRGQLGVSAVAQLNIMSELKEAINVYDDFLAAIPQQ